MKRAKDVDEYIAHTPPDIQGKLRELRAAIRAVVPQAQEKISYGMPYFGYKGRLVYFAYTKHHIGLYALFPDAATLKTDLRDCSTSKGTIRFPLDTPLPITLIKRLVKAKKQNNEQNQKKKQMAI